MSPDALDALVRENLRNAAENGEPFNGWPNMAVAQDMHDGEIAAGASLLEVYYSLQRLRGEDKPCPSCVGNAGRCEDCMGIGEVRP